MGSVAAAGVPMSPALLNGDSQSQKPPAIPASTQSLLPLLPRMALLFCLANSYSSCMTPRAAPLESLPAYSQPSECSPLGFHSSLFFSLPSATEPHPLQLVLFPLGSPRSGNRSPSSLNSWFLASGLASSQHR